MTAAEGALLLMTLGIALALGSVVAADAWEARRFRGRFDCGCAWPSDDDGPQIVTCDHGYRWRFRVWRDWRDRVRDAWDEIETSEGETDD